MRVLMKRLYAIVLRLCENIISLCSVVLFSSFKADNQFKRIKREVSLDDDAYILANGPSLNKFLSDGKFPSKGVFAVNYFSMTPYFNKVKPDNYIVVDPGMCGRAKPEEEEDVSNTLKCIKEIDWEMNMFFPSDTDSKILKILSVNPQINIVLFNRTPLEGSRRLCHFLFRKNLGMPQPQNVTNAAIFCAINCGYKNIYLFGVEHSWTVDLRVNDKNQLCYYEDHFYDTKTERIIPDANMNSILLAIARGFKSHMQLNEYAKTVGCNIYNLTENSLIDAYQRKKLSDIIIK